jgi:hypothetical protein
MRLDLTVARRSFSQARCLSTTPAPLPPAEAATPRPEMPEAPWPRQKPRGGSSLASACAAGSRAENATRHTLRRGADEFPFQHAHDDIVLPSSIDERRFAFAALKLESALAIARDRAAVARQYTCRYPMQPCRENISQGEANGFGTIAFAETGRIFDADRERRPPIMPINPEKTEVTDKAVDVDDPGDLVLLDEADLGLRIAPRENGGRVERAAIGFDDFPVCPQPEASLDILRTRPAKKETRAIQGRNVDCHPGIVESWTTAFKQRTSSAALRLRIAVELRRAASDKSPGSGS